MELKGNSSCSLDFMFLQFSSLFLQSSVLSFILKVSPDLTVDEKRTCIYYQSPDYLESLHFNKETVNTAELSSLGFSQLVTTDRC